jgi:hypothetical protein
MTNTTAAVAGINAALADLQTQLPHIAKDNTAKVPTKTGGGYQYKYADLAQISREVLPLMGKLGLSFTSRPTLTGDGRLVLVYELRHISGEIIEGAYPLPDRGSPQEVGGAITYARRYCLCAVTGVAPDDDDEDAVLAEHAARQQRVERQKERMAQQEAPSEPRISAEQQRQMQTLFQDSNMAEKAKKLEYAISVVKRRIGSATELTQAEADRVIASLQADAERRPESAPDAPESVAEGQS